jgi:predicted O-methyltransferase YrrM
MFLGPQIFRLPGGRRWPHCPAAMRKDQWSAVDRYIADSLLAADPALEATLAAAVAAGLPEIQVTANQGKLLQLFAQMCGARRILELGTLAGYSTIWLARGLPPGGRVVTLEADPSHAEVARKNFAGAGLDGVVELVVGPALETLPRLAARAPFEPFDLIFIDADKENYPAYLEWSLKLSRPGTVIVADNVVRNGAVLDGASADARVQGVRRLYEMIGRDSRLCATALQTVGDKGYDGFIVAIVNSSEM